MNKTTGYRKNFISYDYKKITVKKDQISMFLDGYESFGWIPDENMQQASVMEKYTIPLKRDRKIINKTELTRLQNHFESCMKEIEELENSIHSVATMISIIIGLVGTAFMAGSVFAIVNTPPIIWLGIILAVPAFTCWILPVFLYKRVSSSRDKKIRPIIEQKYNEAYEICEKGNNLLL